MAEITDIANAIENVEIRSDVSLTLIERTLHKPDGTQYVVYNGLEYYRQETHQQYLERQQAGNPAAHYDEVVHTTLPDLLARHLEPVLVLLESYVPSATVKPCVTLPKMLYPESKLDGFKIVDESQHAFNVNKIYLNETCPICFDDFDVGCEILVLSCGHTFHEDCITPWLLSKTVCAHCNTPVKLLEDSTLEPKFKLFTPFIESTDLNQFTHIDEFLGIKPDNKWSFDLIKNRIKLISCIFLLKIQVERLGISLANYRGNLIKIDNLLPNFDQPMTSLIRSYKIPNVNKLNNCIKYWATIIPSSDNLELNLDIIAFNNASSKSGGSTQLPTGIDFEDVYHCEVYRQVKSCFTLLKM